MTTEQELHEQQEQEQEQEHESDERRQALFADDELEDFRSRWDAVQVGFVDEPRASVEKADALVSDLVNRITAGFDESRSGLEDQWSKGEEASTEDLRVALTRYRAFFQRLLAL